MYSLYRSAYQRRSLSVSKFPKSVALPVGASLTIACHCQFIYGTLHSLSFVMVNDR